MPYEIIPWMICGVEFSMLSDLHQNSDLIARPVILWGEIMKTETIFSWVLSILSNSSDFLKMAICNKKIISLFLLQQIKYDTLIDYTSKLSLWPLVFFLFFFFPQFLFHCIYYFLRCYLFIYCRSLIYFSCNCIPIT